MPDQTIQALEAIQGGANVYDYDTAQILRNIERIKPNCIIILDLLDIGFLTGNLISRNGKGKQPFFWAELTLEGKQYLTELKKRKLP